MMIRKPLLLRTTYFLGVALMLLALIGGQASGQTFTTLYNFDGTHGSEPYGSLILSGSTLYGMTYGGGANSDGTIFSLNTVPEPSAFVLLGIAAVSLLAYAWRRRR
jgi:uncharacterized repeat protein (TIGR03803 family)